jgi:tRNA threonylcarbamoyladenosine biosynthesis protein TsaE
MEMTLENLSNIVENILRKVHNFKSENATVVTLQGDLGAGKTTLTQEIARQLGIKEKVISPTFVIMKKYSIDDTSFKYLIHIDAYRLTKSEELMKLGWEEILEDRDNLVILEWPENVPDCIPKNTYNIKLSHSNESTRSIEF